MNNEKILRKRIKGLEEMSKLMLKTLDQITALTKNGRASRLSRATAEFVRSVPIEGDCGITTIADIFGIKELPNEPA